MMESEEAGTPVLKKPDLRKKYDKESLLKHFKQKSHIVMEVFNQNVMFENHDLFIGSSSAQKTQPKENDGV